MKLSRKRLQRLIENEVRHMIREHDGINPDFEKEEEGNMSLDDPQLGSAMESEQEVIDRLARIEQTLDDLRDSLPLLRK